MSEDDARRALAEGARDLIKDQVFQAAILALRKQWQGEKMATSDEKTMVHLTLKQQALEAIAQQLQVFVNDQTMAERKKRYG